MGHIDVEDKPKKELSDKELFYEVANFVVKQGTFATAMIQREFHVGYMRAERVVDKLERMGIVTPISVDKKRNTICKNHEELKQIFCNTKIYNIAGINHRGLDDNCLGNFEGTLQAETDNPYDKYAIAIYTKNRHVGYIPCGNQELWERVIKEHKGIPCRGYIDKGRDENKKCDYYFGEVYVR